MAIFLSHYAVLEYEARLMALTVKLSFAAIAAKEV